MSKGKFLYYDFECTQNTVQNCSDGYIATADSDCLRCKDIDGLCARCSVCGNCKNSLCGMSRHVPNFVVCHSVCDLCRDLPVCVDSVCRQCGSRCDACGKQSKDGRFTQAPCETCGKREMVFKGETTQTLFGDWLFTNHHAGYKVFAHNAKGYDNVFLLHYLVNNTNSKVSTIYSGSKILCLTVPEYKMQLLDSMNFFPFSLKKLGKSFGLNVEKGDFPHMFNTMENFNYVGNYPDSSEYGIDRMSPSDRASFLEWHSSKSNDVFDFQKEMLCYCRKDVEILRMSCTKFRQFVMSLTAEGTKHYDDGTVEYIDCVDPYASITISSLCLNIFRSKFLAEETEQLQSESDTIAEEAEDETIDNIVDVIEDCSIDDTENPPPCKKAKKSKKPRKKERLIESPIGIVPAGGYTSTDCFSKKSILWLELFAKRKKIRIQHALNGGEFKVPGTNYRVDGYYEDPTDPGNCILLEYYGCQYHGCANCTCTDKRPEWLMDGVSYKQRYAMTVERSKKLRALGYKLIEEWEHSADKQMANITEEEKEYLDNLDFVTERLRMRDCLFGGRTNAIKLYHQVGENEVIRYYDVTSLYPYVNKTARYPLGHPSIITDNFQDISKYFGIVQLKILPPKELYLPVLPYRHDGKLLFPLCRTCAETRSWSRCKCPDNDRCITGTYVTEEVKLAVLKGYKIIKIYEIYHYAQSTQYDAKTDEGGLFAQYVNKFLKVKTEASGFPVWADDDVKRDLYINDFYQHEGIYLEKNSVEFNSGLRLICKALLNNLWGRLSMNPQHDRTQICRNPTAFFSILNDNRHSIKDFQIIDDDTVALVYSHDDVHVPQNATTSVVLAAFTTTYGRLELYKYLDVLDRRVLYHDTDSVIFLSDKNHPELDPQLGDFLGDLTDEVPKGKHITRFVSSGPKSYAYLLNDGTEICKVCGFSLNHTAAKLINFETMYNMVADPDIIGEAPDRTSHRQIVYTVNDSKITRDKYSSVIYNRREVKGFRQVYTKRSVQPDLTTLPYGY